MVLEYIEQKLFEIKKIREQLNEEMQSDGGNIDVYRSENLLPRKFVRKFQQMKDMKVACIMDEFTYHSYEPECRLLQITPENWHQEMEDFQPDLFFLESAWNGIDGKWKTKVPHLSDELIDVLSYCKKNDIPVVFWNKEDPVHFDSFIATAKYADYVFTTDIDCIKKYKTLLKHNRVYLLPFAAQTKYHNPIEIYEREDKFCFAGAYYKRFPDRVRDLETFVQAITPLKDLDIYDRNFYNQDPNYQFPNEYKKYIKGNLKPDEIQKAYKGYRFNINMNSVKQSQSMCARRIFELLASNTVTVSNYSRAIRNYFGDLVICTDDGKRLSDEIKKFDDLDYYSKFRLLGLRKVLSEHTYAHRLAFVVEKVFDSAPRGHSNDIAVFSQATSIEEINHIIKQFNRQTYRGKKLFILTDMSPDHLPKLEGVNYISHQSEEIITDIKEQYPYWAFFSAKDYYGRNYLFDLVLAFKYTDSPVICKSTYFMNQDDHITRVQEGKPYQFVDGAKVRISLICSDHFSIDMLMKFIKDIDEGVVSEQGLSIDEFNYCMNYLKDECEQADDLSIADTGIDMHVLTDIVEQIAPSNIGASKISLKANDLLSLIGKVKNVKLRKEHDNLQLESQIANKHQYVYLNKKYRLDELNLQGKTVDLFLNVMFYSRFSLDVVILLLDEKKTKIKSYVQPSNRKVSIELDRRAKYIQLGFRIAGSGSCAIKELMLGNIELDSGCFVNKSNVLLITDNYPDYNDLYRYAFIHSRLVEYKNYGKVVDVFKCNERNSGGYSEFGGIDIASGFYEEVNSALLYGSYDTVLIHFLSETIWNGIKNSVKGKKLVVWVHGAEIQPWWRREYNYSTQRELEIAKKESEKRLNFWRRIFELALSGEYDFHFVFVSNYFANEVFEDIGLRLPEDRFSIIHNYINNELFNYVEKSPELRKKILSIRPFANHKYANDLTVKAIQELAKEPFFKELEFRIIGKGELFHSTVKPIRKYRNVILEEKFLRQEEIAELHKEYGVFLVPTRMDSQGVSRDEAMSSGLVPITNNVAAIPEFVDEECGMLVDAEDYIGIAESIKRLYFEPELFKRLSKKAFERVSRQCGREETIQKELRLISR